MLLKIIMRNMEFCANKIPAYLYRYNITLISSMYYCRSLGLSLPRPDEPPPAPWWNTECDYSLLVGIVKYGEGGKEEEREREWRARDQGVVVVVG